MSDQDDDDELNEYEAVRAINIRRYFETRFEAKTPEEAFEKAKALLGPDSWGVWKLDTSAVSIREDLIDPPAGAWESLAIYDPEGGPGIDFTDVPNQAEPASYSDLLAFVKGMAALEIPHVSTLDRKPMGEAYPDSDDEDMSEAIADLEGDECWSQALELFRLIRAARALVTLKEPMPQKEDA